MEFDERPVECRWAILEMAGGLHPPGDARRLEAHLAECADCRSAAEWNRRLAVLLSNHPLPDAPENIETRVRALLHRRRTLRWMGTAAALASASVLVLLIGTKLLDRPDSGREGGPPARVAVSPVDDLGEFAPLAEDPPVVAAGRLQDSWIAVLTEASEGESK